jgi:hypothetical protein
MNSNIPAVELSIIIEGVDRLGKDTLISGIKDKLGFFQVIHYQKPELLYPYHMGNPTMVIFDSAGLKREALKQYQIQSFRTMFKLLNSGAPLILNRAHLGETVYAPRYRGYSGEYVFDIESVHGERALKTTLLVLLVTSDFSFIADDGGSFDFKAKEAEQDDFIRAFDQSAFNNKLMIDVASKNGFRSKEDIVQQVIS